MAKKPSVPVILYHSVGIPNKNWQWNYLTCPYEVFESQLKWMKKKGFHSISLQQLSDYMDKAISLPKNPVVLTFDDGYLDNWIFAYPLLKKYGFKGTIYVNPEFVDPWNVIRENLEDVWMGDAEIKELKTIGYLSWDELREMENGGVVNIQSHTMTHTWYPICNKIIDFRHPGDPYTWMTWNNNHSGKPYLQIDNENLVNYGEPVYQHGRAIGIRRYFPDENLKEYVINYVKEKGDADFFKSKAAVPQFKIGRKRKVNRATNQKKSEFFSAKSNYGTASKNWRDELFEIAGKYKEENRVNERYETEEEYEERVYYELQKSKEIIEDKLDKEVRFLCWPGGAVTDKALKMASDIGYISSTAGKDIMHRRKYLRNRYGEDSSRINRIGITLYWDGVEGFGSKIKYKNGFYFVLSLYRFQGGKIISPLSLSVLISISGLYKLKYEIFEKINAYVESKKMTAFKNKVYDNGGSEI